jgi:transcriptional regulator with XRE-family HTH domain
MAEKKTAKYRKSRMVNGPAGGDLADRIRLIADRVGRAGLSRVAGVSEAQIFRYISRENEPKVSVLLRLAEAAGVRVEWLATGKGAMEADGAGDASELDEELLIRILAGLDAVCDERGIELQPDARARFSVAIYRQVMATISDGEDREAMVDAVIDGIRPLLDGVTAVKEGALRFDGDG